VYITGVLLIVVLILHLLIYENSYDYGVYTDENCKNGYFRAVHAKRGYTLA
jgi:hypothetical protein